MTVTVAGLHRRVPHPRPLYDEVPQLIFVPAVAAMLASRGAEVAAIALQALATLFSERFFESAPVTTNLLTVLWPDIVVGLLAPGVQEASDALDPASIPQLVAFASTHLREPDAPPDVEHVERTLPLLAQTAEWAAGLKLGSSCETERAKDWAYFCICTASLLLEAAANLDPQQHAELSSRELLLSSLRLAATIAKAAGPVLADAPEGACGQCLT